MGGRRRSRDRAALVSTANVMVVVSSTAIVLWAGLALLLVAVVPAVRSQVPLQALARLLLSSRRATWWMDV